MDFSRGFFLSDLATNRDPWDIRPCHIGAILYILQLKISEKQEQNVRKHISNTACLISKKKKQPFFCLDLIVSTDKNLESSNSFLLLDSKSILPFFSVPLITKDWRFRNYWIVTNSVTDYMAWLAQYSSVEYNALKMSEQQWEGKEARKGGPSMQYSMDHKRKYHPLIYAILFTVLYTAV